LKYSSSRSPTGGVPSRFGRQLNAGVIGHHVGVGSQRQQSSVVWTGEKRHRRTRTGWAPSNTPIAAPIAVSSWNASRPAVSVRL
jgi:hypothetical protein